MAASRNRKNQSIMSDLFANHTIEQLGQSGFALAIQLLKHREDAADAVQDSLQRVLQKRNSFDPSRGTLKVWFLKIVRNRCLDLLKSSRRRNESETIERNQPTTSAADRPDIAVEKRETLHCLKEQLMRLPVRQRELILLKDFHELRYAEIAQILSIPVGSVMSGLHRARAELRKRMQGSISG